MATPTRAGESLLFIGRLNFICAQLETAEDEQQKVGLRKGLKIAMLKLAKLVDNLVLS